jgi:hypothetical protein
MRRDNQARGLTGDSVFSEGYGGSMVAEARYRLSPNLPSFAFRRAA